MTAARNIVCPHCARTNRVPADRPARAARCGACHHLLFEGRPAKANAAGFAKHRRNNDIPVLVDVWAPWCDPCRAMAPMFEQAAAELEPDVRLLKVNSEEEPGVASELGARGIPALFLLHKGKVVAQTAGAMETSRIVAWTRAQIAKAAGLP
ncbi:thioredoxin TrxC [Methylobacterium nigriterrae]|uniref:thioredoxin TrxC n=1 Tax=Methylobacterium nigriterrae TaxID=3127512 RepID=UPI0030138371